MGATTNEIPCIREAGDHPDRRTVAPPGLAHAGAVWHPAPDLLSLVRPLSRRRPGGVGGSAIGPAPGVEPHRRRYPAADHRHGAGYNRSVAPRTGGALHRREALLRVGGHGLSPTQGP